MCYLIFSWCSDSFDLALSFKFLEKLQHKLIKYNSLLAKTKKVVT